jgi:hypothetical protein
LLGLLLLPTTPSHAARLDIQPLASTSQGFPLLEFELLEAFEGIYAEAMNSGLPTTLTYTIEVWRQRGGWWDKLEDAYEREFRLFRDLLNEQYVIATPSETRRVSTLDSLAISVCRFRLGTDNGPLYLARELFAPEKRYYVVVVATLAPLTVEDLAELDDWVRGSIRGGRDDSGGISGLSRTMGGMLMSLTGFGDQRVKSRTDYFRLSDIRPTPLPPPRPDAPAPHQLAVPDSGSGP